MKKIRVAFAALLGALALGAATPASAALVNFTIDFTASGFAEYPGASTLPPYDPIHGNLTFSFENSSYISPTTSGVTINILTLPSNFRYLYTYDPQYDIISFSTTPFASGCDEYEEPNGFCSFIMNASTNPTMFDYFSYFETDENDNGRLFVTRNISSHIVSISGVPEPTSWVLLLTGIGAIGWAIRRRKAVPEARRTVLSEGLPV